MKEFKKIKIIFAVAAIVALFVSCSEDMPDNGGSGTLQNGSLLIISAGSDIDANDPTTRAYVYPDRTQTPTKYTYYWEPGDKIKLTVTNTGSGVPLSSFDRLELTSTLTAEATKSNFVINSEPEMYAELQTAQKFDFYAYFPNGWTSVQRAPTGGEIDDRDFPNSLSFRLPDTYSGQHPNIFEAGRTPMVDSVLNHAPTILYDTGNASSLLTAENEAVKFSFNHITSYLSLEMDFSGLPNPESYKVDNIIMTVGSGNTAANMINGLYTYSRVDGTHTVSGGTNVINYTGMVNMGDGDRLSIPMPPKKFKGFKFQCTFHGDESGKTITVESADTEITFLRGTIHHIKITPKQILSVGESELLYFDLRASNGGIPLKLGSWGLENDDAYYGPNDEFETETLTPAMVNSADYALAFFKFGSVIGFTNEDGWTSTNRDNDIKFNPTSTATYSTYANIPAYSDDDRTKSLTVFDPAYHNATNIRAGKGDPCRLAGFDMTYFNSLSNNNKTAYLNSYDSGWRLPTRPENRAFVGLAAGDPDNIWLMDHQPTTTNTWMPGYFRWDGDDNNNGQVDTGEYGTGVFLKNPVGESHLPAAGIRNQSGTSQYVGSYGNYWSGEASDKEGNGFNFGFQGPGTDANGNDPRAVANSPNSRYNMGYAIRCVRQ
jgi:hypothetical protein